MTMIDVHVAEAMPPVLDWLVAKAIGRQPQDRLDLRGRVVTGDGFLFGSPSRHWDDGGPLLQGYRVAFLHVGDAGFCAVTDYGNGGAEPGPDHLTAGMRAIVATYFGEVTKVPAEIAEANHG